MRNCRNGSFGSIAIEVGSHLIYMSEWFEKIIIDGKLSRYLVFALYNFKPFVKI